jgi:hypothetical protein
MDEAMAAAIVARRDSVAEDRRFDRFWPITEGVVGSEAWLPVVGEVTTRSFVWRATFAVGVVPADDPDAPLESPIVWEVVVDCGGEAPRLVEVRDVTMLELVARMIADSADRAPSFEDPEADASGVDSGLLDDLRLFDDQPLFSEQPLFEFDSILDGPPLFSGDSTPDDPFAGRSGGAAEPNVPSPTPLPRDRGPGGRWRPATGSR